MDHEAPAVRAPRGTAVIRSEAAVLADEANRRWWVHRLDEAGWPLHAIASHFDLPPERVGQIVAGTLFGEPRYVARRPVPPQDAVTPARRSAGAGSR